MFTNEVMRPEVKWVSPDLTLLETARMMRDLNIGCLPVGENDRLVGIVTDRDIACRGVAEGCNPATTTVRDVMSKRVVYCFDDNDVSEAAWYLEKEHLHRIVVLNRNKRMVGLLSLADIATHCPHELTGHVMDAVSRPGH